ncbi:MAG TPA: type II toxin-antitoxin system RelE/ParE family toxin [Pirellulaceae bacterium]|nr:type II toxin-antitoxin system RelE/ParE family toxin [Pirellulaceae bacterium]
MNYTVVVTTQAEENVDVIYRWIAKFSPSGAAHWYQAYLTALKSLKRDAERCGQAHESAKLSEPLREALFRTRKGLRYRLIFKIIAEEVHVLYVRGHGQDDID